MYIYTLNDIDLAHVAGRYATPSFASGYGAGVVYLRRPPCWLREQHAIVGHKEICAFGIHLPCYVCPGYRCRSGHMYGSPVFFQAFKTSLVTIMDSLQVCRETKVPFLHVFGVHILADGSGSSSNERAGLRRGPCV